MLQNVRVLASVAILLGVVESAAAALLGGGDDSDESDDAGGDDGGVSDDDAFSTDSGGDSTSLGDAQAFDYTPDAESDDATEIAGRGVRMTGNEPGGYRVNPNGQDVDYFDSDGNLSAQYHGSHGDPHGHNFDNGVRDDMHLPMSSINFD